jgi:arylsulfatase A-like enzyme
LLTAVCLCAAICIGAIVVTAPQRAVASNNQTPRKPNIVFILGDDLGYCDVSMYGCREIPTPNIDSIAAAGVRFTNGYVTAPVCSPSRAGLITGRYQQRFGFEFNAGPLQRALSEPEMGLPASEITLAELMKKAGYATGMASKWHLGMHEKFNPINRGFDEYFGFLFGANMYIAPDEPGVKSSDPEGIGVRIRSARNPIVRGLTPVEEKEYLTDALARESVAFIERHRNEPFFLYAPFNRRTRRCRLHRGITTASRTSRTRSAGFTRRWSARSIRPWARFSPSCAMRGWRKTRWSFS